MYGGEERYIQDLVRRSEDRRPLGRSRHRWENNINMKLKEFGWEGVDSLDLDQE
jgi:hypothetical protein